MDKTRVSTQRWSWGEANSIKTGLHRLSLKALHVKVHYKNVKCYEFYRSIPKN